MRRVPPTRFAAVAWVLIAALAPALARSQVPARSSAPPSPKYIGRLIGVFDESTGDPIDSVEIRDVITGSYTFTTRTGTVALSFVDTAGSLIRIRKFGYSPITMFIGNAPGLPPVTLTLEPIAQRLPTVVTRDSVRHYLSPALSAFEERRKTGMGYFVSEAELRKEDNRPLANVLRSHVATLAIQDIVMGGQRVTIATSRRGNGGACPVDVFLDGVKLNSNQQSGTLTVLGSGRSRGTALQQGYVDLTQFLVMDLAGLEFHNVGDMPAEFEHTGGGCGGLYLWTRER